MHKSVDRWKIPTGVRYNSKAQTLIGWTRPFACIFNSLMCSIAVTGCVDSAESGKNNIGNNKNSSALLIGGKDILRINNNSSNGNADDDSRQQKSPHRFFRSTEPTTSFVYEPLNEKWKANGRIAICFMQKYNGYIMPRWYGPCYQHLHCCAWGWKLYVLNRKA